MECEYLVVGAGLYGSVIAERIANDLQEKVLVIDKRPHIGGNCFSFNDEETGIAVPLYGSHIFHTSSQKAWEYITRFTEFNGYHHQVLTVHDNKVYQMPINLETINSFYNLNLNPSQAKEFLKKEIEKEGIQEPSNLEEKAISLIGRPLYEAFIKNYTAKQWDKSPRELPAKIIDRLPVRFNYAEEYFKNARWQGLPLEGFTKVFENMLNSPKIAVKLKFDFFEQRDNIRVRKKTIYTGPIDRFFNYKFGKLEWRGVEFERRVFEVEDFQGTSVMNYADSDVPYTRIHEPRHLHPERAYGKEKTVIFYETSKSEQNNPYYPINTDKNYILAQQYKILAEQEKDTIIGGRLGDYAYYDMDKTILAALKCYEERIVKKIN